ncbi:cell division protein FtsA [Ichthyobacterium seriolicida]|uniref:Cell division protein FtsA n=1 Tax=Ichthyobacterium seriolicida TaxID=242600 RepID=A0A1J1DZA7_9FLAO|nr:cell division protein FtsA [Ichthyobacterium seriolicida]BAV95250.1 cell division protein FtsA [Ichthyobacterium seriolicida]
MIAGLDIGSSHIIAMVGDLDAQGKLNVLGVGKSDSIGIVKGEIKNITKAKDSILKAISIAEKNSNKCITGVVVGISGNYIDSIHRTHHIIRNDGDSLINDYDLKLLKDQVYNVHPKNVSYIIGIIPQEYRIDNEEGVLDPIGAPCSKLEADFKVITADKKPYDMLVRCIKETGLNLIEVVFAPIFSSSVVLSEKEKKDGVVFVDMGGGITNFLLFNGDVRDIAIVPFGGKVITSDIKKRFNLTEEVAENLKITEGSVDFFLEKKESFLSVKMQRGPDRSISKRNLSKTIYSRIREIFEIAMSYGVFNENYNIVFVGGGANTEGVRNIVKEVTGLYCSIGGYREFLSKSNDISLVTCVGLTLEAIKLCSSTDCEKVKEIDEKKLHIKNKKNYRNNYDGIVEKINKWFNYLVGGYENSKY